MSNYFEFSAKGIIKTIGLTDGFNFGNFKIQANTQASLVQYDICSKSLL